MTQDWARPVVHWELVAEDPARLRTFYADLFNWEIGEGEVMPISPGVGGPSAGPGGQIRKGARKGLALYIQVRDLDESVERARALGAQLVRDRVQVPGGATLAAIDDPEGNRLMLVQQ